MTTSILIIAGSDSCAGAGMQIDLKTAAAHGVYATCALTAVTAQNTTEVTAIQPVDPEIVQAQVEAVFADIAPRAVKVGMLGTKEVAEAVADTLSLHRDVPVVLDPVLVATAGGELTSAEAFDAIRDCLIPRATVVTPNLPEARALTGADPADITGIGTCANRFLNMGADAVLIKGGHGTEDTIYDRLYMASGMRKMSSKRLKGEFHGTGCSLSTAIACNLARGFGLEESVLAAHDYLADALSHELALGGGSKIFNPLNRLSSLYGATK